MDPNTSSNDASTEVAMPEKRDVNEPNNEVLVPAVDPANRAAPLAHRPVHREQREVIDQRTGRKKVVEGRLSRQGMIDVVRRGGSFHLPTDDGITIVSKLEDIPSEADMAQITGSTDDLDRALRDNDDLIKRLQLQQSRLTEAKAKAQPPIPTAEVEATGTPSAATEESPVIEQTTSAQSSKGNGGKKK